MNPEEFGQKLLVYGADVQAWPRGEREAGLRALEDSADLRSLLAEEERFEEILKTRRHEEPSGDLAARIVSASQRKGKQERRSLIRFFSDLLWEFGLPRPALIALSVSIVLLFIIGFAVSFSSFMEAGSADQYQADLQELLYDEGEVL
jgi:hypothetical protein